MTADSITELFGRLSARAGLSRNVTPRMLRRAAGSNLADAGGGQDEIAAMLDHARLSSAEPYLTAAPDRLRNAVDAVPSPRELAPGSDASDAELAAFLWSLIDSGFLDGAGWNAERRVLDPPIGHPTLGRRRCPVAGCISPVKGLKLCSTCATRLRKSLLSYEEFVQIPRTAPYLHLPVGDCRVGGCERPWTDSGGRPVCRTHWWQLQKYGGSLEEFLADPAAKGLPSLGDCAALACNRRAVSAGDTRLCHPHEKRLWALREEPDFDEEAWLRTAPSTGFAAKVSFRGLPELVVAQLLFGLQHRCHRGACTEIGNFRALIDRTIRPSGAQRLEDVPDPAANSDALNSAPTWTASRR
ncbi:tyrosine-type recombinase/integrase [Streptomyces sp. NBC_00154]|uniref:tyrosine-type recombinase/integrase n=1 Tax=Streptomyces sp. NBC_00154 TaxID=2975670 RepID=UPI0022503F60|nr:tyrosine-type recombinase/integrase [Streptomyces sp. NBC_00154]MCX5316675.1 site-specific integrase [Streptomyces sp. NBC_00154]